MDLDDYEDGFRRKPARTTAKVAVRVWLIVGLCILLAGALAVGVWFWRVGTSDTRGQGNAEIIKNEAKNRIRAQEGFEDKFAAIVTADRNLTLTAEALKAKPGDVKLSTELTGQKMVCNDAVGRYNADARKFSKEDFRNADLPGQIDDTDPATDCKES